MRFGNYPRVTFGKNTIDEVICQVRFPPILKITEEIASFQDRIRKKYPEMAITAVSPEMPEQLFQLFAASGRMPLKASHYTFSDETKIWKVSIDSQFLSLTCNLYDSFEPFAERFFELVGIFNELFDPSYYQRLGLRYRNIVVQDYLRAEQYQWKDLIAKNIAPELSEDVFSDRIKLFEKKTFLEEKESKANAIYALVKGDASFRGKQYDNTAIYIIDIDCFTEEKQHDSESIQRYLSEFNLCVRDLFRHGISEKLYELMEPSPHQ